MAEIRQDGKVYTFKPGRNGSLTAPSDKKAGMNFDPPQVRAKVVMPEGQRPCDNCKEPMLSSSSSCSACGATRG